MTATPKQIRIEDFDYPLPEDRIALHPLAQRDSCKLLVLKGDSIEDHKFSDLPSILPKDTLLVCNNTRVINARLRFRKPTGGAIEIFCLEPTSPADYEQSFAQTRTCRWSCLIGNSKKWKAGPLTMEVKNEDGNVITELCAERTGEVGADGSPEVIFNWTGNVSFSEVIAAAGEIPIPPYLNRSSEESDLSDYQTVFSHIEGSVAAPTAGLHFTPELLQKIEAEGIERAEVTLHVGAGTFRPVKSREIGDHDMHSEYITVSAQVIEQLLNHRGPVIAVGTTAVRTLESLYQAGCLISMGKWKGEVPQWWPYSEEHPHLSAQESLSVLLEYLKSNALDLFCAYTRIIIAPGYDYKIVEGMITNFHQPRSTLLLLVSAFIGDNWVKVYEHALSDGSYRFLSYGDACLFLRD